MASCVGLVLCRRFVPGALRQTVPAINHSSLNFKLKRFLMSRATPIGTRSHLAAYQQQGRDCPRSPHMPFGVRSIIITTDLPAHEKNVKNEEEDDEAEDDAYGVTLSKKPNEERHQDDPGRVDP